MKNNIKIVDKIEKIAIKDLKIYERDPKKHPEEQIEKIAQQIKLVGFLIPILVDDENLIIAGRGRYFAAIKIGMKFVPCIRAKHLTPEQVRAFRIADNKVAESEWDEEMMLQEIGELLEKGIEIESIGFDEQEFEEMLREIEKPIKKDKKISRKDAKTPRKTKNNNRESKKNQFRIMVECRSGREKQALLERCKSEGLECWPVN
jgi:ParB-like chromosome segregation protein Spo0J